MLRPVVGEHPAHFLHSGNQKHIPQENHHTNQAFQQIQNQNAGNGLVKEGGNRHGQQEKQRNGQAQAHSHRNADQRLLKALAAQLLFQPQVKLSGLLLHLLRSQVRGAHQRLDANHLGIEEIENAPDKGEIFPGALGIQLPV